MDELRSITEQFEVMENWFGRFPLLLASRFFVDPSTEIQPEAPFYTPDRSLDASRAFITGLERRGHAVSLHGLSEKLNICDLESLESMLTRARERLAEVAAQASAEGRGDD